MLTNDEYESVKQKLLNAKQLIDEHEAEMERIRIANRTKYFGFGIGDTVSVDWNDAKWEIAEFYPSKYHKGGMRAKLKHKYSNYKSKTIWDSEMRRYREEEVGLMICSTQVELLRQPTI